ncbi:glycosyltransferase [Polaribacter glomeratus]|uniref:Glycosyl transferase family 2 n=1 Tax=Polaribacter glomeratus TaxID=102 RepID=A0A2S7WH65_9FLAO|nr:glycosyltransferase family 2 protein [Polaribacter glomeratus]PQJ76954.1 hypothetical protein BTO16_13925 [Polaribacter glomeratus]TXD67198.1 glycosyltransferase family 2 protein [Polaribacter glomeratus]
MIVFEILNFFLVLYLGASVLFLISYAILGKFHRKIKKPLNSKKNRFVVFIPAYKEDAVIYGVAKKALNQDYPSELFDIIVIADSFQQKTLDDLNLLPIIVKEVSFIKSTKAKALNKTMEELPETLYDIALILDADNVLALDFIAKINESFNAGFHVVQGHRTAKNTKGAFAMLDAMSEEINNNIFSKGHRAIGLSSRLVGSGMAVSYQLFKEIMKNVDVVVAGEDKELELTLLKRGYKIEYRDDAICYDEKVSQSEVFNNQRIRWISAQFHYFKKDFLTAFWHLIIKGNIDYFDKAFQMMLPPRLILHGFLFAAVIIAFFLSPELYFYVWLGIFLVNVLSYAISIPRRFYSIEMVHAFMSLPQAFFGVFITLFKASGVNANVGHTTHTYVDEEDTN